MYWSMVKFLWGMAGHLMSAWSTPASASRSCKYSTMSSSQFWVMEFSLTVSHPWQMFSIVGVFCFSRFPGSSPWHKESWWRITWRTTWSEMRSKASWLRLLLKGFCPILVNNFLLCTPQEPENASILSNPTSWWEHPDNPHGKSQSRGRKACD